MRIYIGYKYRYIKDKSALIRELSSLADRIQNLGHTAFILGRDIQNWSEHTHSKFSTFVQIFKNIGKYDVLFAYVNSEAHSNGLPVELILAKLFGLKSVYARLKSIRPGFFEKFFDKRVEFESVESLKAQLPDLLKF